MRIPVLIVACITALLTVGALAQQSVPDAPQPAKKQTAKPPDPAPPVPPPAKDDNAFPEEVSKKAADAANQTKQPQSGPETKPGTSDDNPFPEERSKAAAKPEENDPLPPVNDPARSRKDEEVGKFYLQTGDYHGALLRFQDATASDPTNANAIFGLAEAQHQLKNNADALRNYELFLDIVPNGPKAKQALKALKDIQAGK